MVAACIAKELAALQDLHYEEKKESRKAPRVVLCGGAAIDIIGKPRVLASDNSNMGGIEVIPGGCARNTLECLNKLGVLDTLLVSAIGRDTFGQMLLEDMEQRKQYTDGLCVSKEEHTGLYMCTMHEGSATGVSDMDILAHIPKAHVDRFRSEIAGAKVVALDANLDASLLKYICEIATNALGTSYVHNRDSDFRPDIAGEE